MSYNEAILKIMVPYGNKQNVPSNYAYPWKISEGKYGIQHEVVPADVTTSSFTVTYSGNMGYYYPTAGNNANVQAYTKTLHNKISIINGLYEESYAGGNTIGLLGQNANWYFFSNRSNGYALCYQDNYEDKPEIRVHSYYHKHFSRTESISGWGRTSTDYYENFYSKNGYAINAGSRLWIRVYYSDFFTGSGDQLFQTTEIPIYKTSSSQHNGFLPIISVAS